MNLWVLSLAMSVCVIILLSSYPMHTPLLVCGEKSWRQFLIEASSSQITLYHVKLTQNCPEQCPIVRLHWNPILLIYSFIGLGVWILEFYKVQKRKEGRKGGNGRKEGRKRKKKERGRKEGKERKEEERQQDHCHHNQGQGISWLRDNSSCTSDSCVLRCFKRQRSSSFMEEDQAWACVILPNSLELE